MSICQIPVPPFSLGVHVVFDSMLCVLENPNEYEKGLVEVALNSSFRVIDMWGNTSTFPPLRGNSNALIPDDPGLSEQEAFPVYDVMDKVFTSVFPELPLERSMATDHVKELINKAHNLIVGEPNFSSQDELEALKDFSRRVIEATRVLYASV